MSTEASDVINSSFDMFLEKPPSKFVKYFEEQSKKILTIPIHQNLTQKEIKNVVLIMNKFASDNKE